MLMWMIAQSVLTFWGLDTMVWVLQLLKTNVHHLLASGTNLGPYLAYVVPSSTAEPSNLFTSLGALLIRFINLEFPNSTQANSGAVF